MVIAFDAALFYDIDNDVLYPGMVEMVETLHTMNDNNSIIIWSDEGAMAAKKIGKLASIPNVVKYDAKQTAVKPDVHFATKMSSPKGIAVIHASY